MLSTIIICTLVQLSINNPQKTQQFILNMLSYLLGLPLIANIPLVSSIRLYLNNSLSLSLKAHNDDITKTMLRNLVKNVGPTSNASVFDTNNIESLSYSELLLKYEKDHNTKVIFIHHSLSNRSPLYGLSFLTNSDKLTMSDAIKFVDTLKSIDENTNITLFLNTPGGSLAASEVIINAMMLHNGKITVCIPYMSSSTGTLIALAADSIYMCDTAFCGPIDPQLYYFSAKTILHYCEGIKNTLRPNSTTYDSSYTSSVIRDIVELFRCQAEATVARIVNIINKINDHKYNKLGKREELEPLLLSLLHGERNHDEPIFAHEFSTLISNVQTNIPDDALALYKAHLSSN